MSKANVGHKINPTAYRIGVIEGWKSRYFRQRGLPLALQEDSLIREFLRKKLAKMGVEKIEIERSLDDLKIIIRSSRPGLIIGRGGTGIEDIRAALIRILARFRGQKKIAGRINMQLTIEEVRHPEISAQIVAENISAEIEKRSHFRRTIKQALARVMQHKEVMGSKIMVSGRLDGAEISRTEWIAEGKIPLATLRADIDYGTSRAECTYGTVGIKVWIYKGEKFEKKE